jgi:hypothetical protein
MQDISDIRLLDSDTLQIEERSKEGTTQLKNMLDFSAKEIYTIVLQAYELGDRDARKRISDALEGRTSYS